MSGELITQRSLVQIQPPQPTPCIAGCHLPCGVCTVSRVAGKPYFTYILWSPSGQRFYVGISEDPSRRLDQHNQGISRWTARYRPWQLVRVERFTSYTDARKRELLLKMQKSGRGLFQLTGLDPAVFLRTPKGS